MTVTVLRLRPAERVHELWASTRRREGTTTVEVPHLDGASRSGAVAGRIGPVSIGLGDAEPLAWVVSPEEALELGRRGVPGWRITVRDEGRRETVLDALARSRAAYLRTGRRRVAEAAEMVSLPGLSTRVSVYVDTVEDAVLAVQRGAADLLLRDWDREALADLREALGSLEERTALPPGVTVDEARDALDAELFALHLDQIDATGHARPRTEWAPGKDLPPPVPRRRFSARWDDPRWLAAAPDGLEGVADDLRRILEGAREGRRPSRDELVRLLSARGAEVDAVAQVADEARAREVGDTVTFVVNRNINYTNQCYFRCGFCAFSKGPRSLELRGEPYLMTIEEVVARAVEARDRGATEVTLQGGIHPEFTGDFYVRVVEAIKEAAPELHIHGFTPLEVWQGAETSGVSVRDLLVRLREAGLGTLPGTAAEILSDRVREHLCPDKIRTSQWAEVMLTAHELGLRSTATIMFGHIDDPEAWADHLEVLREIQRRSGGITEFIPLPFVHMGAPIYLRGRARPGPTWDEVVLVHAVGRLAFVGLIDHVQVSWVKLGLEGAARLLQAGCDDLGGTLMDENISRAAGASHGTRVDAEDLAEVARSVGRRPQRRTTLYEALTPSDRPVR